MNERLFRTQFDQMETTEKQALMERLAARYAMTFLGLQPFDRWGQNCTTGIFEKDGREFVFVPGDTVTLGWEQFAVGLNQESREELEYLFREWELEEEPGVFIRERMAPVRQAAIGPMLAGRELEEINWEPVKLDDPRLRPEWLEDFRQFALTDRDSLTLAGRARFEREGNGWQASIYHRIDYPDFQSRLQKQGLSLPTADEWAYLCGGGCRTLFPWGDGLDYSMRLRWFEAVSYTHLDVYKRQDQGRGSGQFYSLHSCGRGSTCRSSGPRQRPTPDHLSRRCRWCSSGPSGQRYVDREKSSYNEQQGFPSAPASQ